MAHEICSKRAKLHPRGQSSIRHVCLAGIIRIELRTHSNDALLYSSQKKISLFATLNSFNITALSGIISTLKLFTSAIASVTYLNISCLDRKYWFSNCTFKMQKDRPCWDCFRKLLINGLHLSLNSMRQECFYVARISNTGHTKKQSISQNSEGLWQCLFNFRLA